MRLFLLLTIGTCVSAAYAQPNADASTIANPPTRKVPAPLKPPAPRTGTPQEQIEADIRQFLASLNSLTPDKTGYRYSIPDAISGARVGFFGFDEWAADFCRQRATNQYRLDQLEFEQLEPGSARVKISYSLVSTAEKNGVRATLERPEPVVETLDLKRETVPWNHLDKWRIVPPLFEDLPVYLFGPRLSSTHRPLALGYVAYFASQRAGTYQQLRGETAMSHLKQCWLGATMFAQDYDDQYVTENEFWREALRPYLRNDAVLLIPTTQMPFTFNDKLSGQNTKQIAKPAQTVLFYEGENEKPIFRYDGKAAIAFADGHVVLVSPEEAKTLIWRP